MQLQLSAFQPSPRLRPPHPPLVPPFNEKKIQEYMVQPAGYKFINMRARMLCEWTDCLHQIRGGWDSGWTRVGCLQLVCNLSDVSSWRCVYYYISTKCFRLCTTAYTFAMPATLLLVCIILAFRSLFRITCVRISVRFLLPHKLESRAFSVLSRASRSCRRSHRGHYVCVRCAGASATTVSLLSGTSLF